jgi:tRNA(Ile)-lysidine synthetase-like protein
MFTTSIPSNTIVAVSGGIDSIAASFLLNRKFGIKKIFHFNHNYQAVNKDMEAAVKQYANDYGLELILARSDVPLTSEAECRKARLNAIFEGKNTVLATAHHLDDFVESHILNFVRGKEAHFAIPFETDFGNDNKIIHPFLFYTKKQFEHIIEKNNLSKYVVHDPSNFISKGSRRNFIRNEIVPILENNKLGMRKICRKKILQRLDEQAKYGV